MDPRRASRLMALGLLAVLGLALWLVGPDGRRKGPKNANSTGRPSTPTAADETPPDARERPER